MKNSKLLRRVVGILLTIIALTAFLAGCGSSKDSSSTQKQSQGRFQGRGSFDPAAMKTRYENGLKELVSDGTITQDQSDKVMSTLTANLDKMQQQRNSNNNGQTNNTQQNNGQGRQNRIRSNPLSELVSSGVITQAQSDAIMQKIRGNFQHQQNNQSSQSYQ